MKERIQTIAAFGVFIGVAIAYVFLEEWLTKEIYRGGTVLTILRVVFVAGIGVGGLWFISKLWTWSKEAAHKKQTPDAAPFIFIRDLFVVIGAITALWGVNKAWESGILQIVLFVGFVLIVLLSMLPERFTRKKKGPEESLPSNSINIKDYDRGKRNKG